MGYNIRMQKHPDLPPGWAMPAGQANRLKQNLEKRSKPPEQELDDALRDIARDIAILEPDPQHWQGWLMIFISHLETEARQRRKQISYQEMVKSLGSRLSNY